MKEAPVVAAAEFRAVESPANPLWKELRAAARRGESFRNEYWLVETTRLLDEALRSQCDVAAVFAGTGRMEEFRARWPMLPASVWVPVSERAMATLPGTDSSQGLLALVRQPRHSVQALFASDAVLVVLDRLQDPGNAGTILRAAEAFGATGLVFLEGSASPDSGKVLRASAGSLFRLPFVAGITAADLMQRCAAARIPLFAADAAADAAVGDIAWKAPMALVIGNEGAGIRTEIQAAATGFRIPTSTVESLNAAMSAAIALYVIRQTMSAGRGDREPRR